MADAETQWLLRTRQAGALAPGRTSLEDIREHVPDPMSGDLVAPSSPPGASLRAAGGSVFEQSPARVQQVTRGEESAPVSGKHEKQKKPRKHKKQHHQRTNTTSNPNRIDGRPQGPPPVRGPLRAMSASITPSVS